MKLYPLVLSDGGRNISKRPRQSADCTVRALAIVTEIKYDLAYDTLKVAGRKCNDGFDLAKWLKKMDVFYGWKCHKLKSKGMTIDKLFEKQCDNMIIELYDHVFAIKKNQAHDLIREDGDSEVLGIWQFSRE